MPEPSYWIIVQCTTYQCTDAHTFGPLHTHTCVQPTEAPQRVFLLIDSLYTQTIQSDDLQQLVRYILPLSPTAHLTHNTAKYFFRARPSLKQRFPSTNLKSVVVVTSRDLLYARRSNHVNQSAYVCALRKWKWGAIFPDELTCPYRAVNLSAISQ